ncbi:fimbria/pilus periplasmic chaperone [Cupriavidus sp. IDO]|uniref:fimbria/pilus periplasmic chaperone n=1 Tax=Cupriavidus sp. IDO TaxID=1539142 RepID=UPI0005795650|nr:fimbria/pilus periplasmic chaperone [Cupriavidus sp. IDO]KWR81582.1 hypothetical protein RM96_28875 [Cupriavidus sp. IDO]
MHPQTTSKTLLYARLALGLALGLTVCSGAQASIVIGATRVVYKAQDTEVTVKLSNEGRNPALTQVWLDTGNPNDDPSLVSTPFTVVPPLARIEAGKGQTLRILHTASEPMATDKESLFWLNVLEVPPKPKAGGGAENTLQLAFRSRIKLFYRPSELQGSAAQAPEQVRWRLVRGGSAPALEATNPTSFHVSFTTLELLNERGAAEPASEPIAASMVAPGATKRFALPEGTAITAGTKVRYHAINDYGGDVEGISMLDPGHSAAHASTTPQQAAP